MKKALKPKHFRYLSKQHRKDPNYFLETVVHGWGINWPNHFNFLVNSCIYAPMRNPEFEYGFMTEHLGQMIEAAYLILAKCAVEPLPKNKAFCYAEGELLGTIEDDAIFPEQILRKFFAFKTLQEWYTVLHNLQQNRDVSSTSTDESFFGMDCLPIRELLVQLPRALEKIHLRGGVRREFTLPA